MAESDIHISLVCQLKKYIIDYLKIDHGFVLVDASSTLKNKKPPIVGGYIPDIYVKTKNTFIIADAKTAKDWQSKHSLDQYNAFVCECAKHENSMFLLAVPWQYERSAHSRLKFLFPAQTSVKIEVISDMWGL